MKKRSVALVSCVGAWAVVSAEATAALPISAEEAHAFVVPFYRALSADSDDGAELLRSVTARGWVQCIGNDEASCESREKTVQDVLQYRQDIPDIEWNIKAVYVSGETIVVRGEVSGTPEVDFSEYLKKGIRFRAMSVDIHTVKDGKITRTYTVADWLRAQQPSRF